MKPFHSGIPGHRKSLWADFPMSEKCRNGFPDSFVKGMVKHSQVDFTKAAEARMLLLFNSLYPVELPWFDMTGIGEILVNDENQERLAGCLTNFEKGILSGSFFRVKNGTPLPGTASPPPVDYFTRLENEYRYLVSEAEHPAGPFILLRNYTDYNAWKEGLTSPGGEKKMAAVVCIEGAHSFLNFRDYRSMLGYKWEVVTDDQWTEFPAFRDMLLENIGKVKCWGPDTAQEGAYAPLYITFSHHFWNLLAGHTRSLFNCFLDQAEGMDQSFSTLGRLAVEKLLDRSGPGRRILIDIKHLSFFARNAFYDLQREHRHTGDNFPIIASHAAVTGTADPSKPPHAIFNSCDINLFDWDIQQIHTSGGLIGIMMEEGRLLKKEVLQFFHQRYQSDPDLLRRKLAEIVLAQMLHIVRVCGKQSGWDLPCLGTDFDGMINSLDSFDSAMKVPGLAAELFRLLDREVPVLQPDVDLPSFIPNGSLPLFSSAEVKQLKYGLSADEIVDKFSFGNIERFLQHFFHDEYLKNLPTQPFIT